MDILYWFSLAVVLTISGLELWVGRVQKDPKGLYNAGMWFILGVIPFMNVVVASYILVKLIYFFGVQPAWKKFKSWYVS